MMKTSAMFWSGETLRERLAPLIEPFAPERVDCAAYTLSVGPEVYVSPNDQTADPTTVTFASSPRAMRFPAHRGDCRRPGRRACLHFYPREDQVSRAGQRLGLLCRSGLSRPADL